ncbi:unnamed protein product [Vitrella brassicaformis CCMP3155]|uniref:Uncharacterized protein n=1 Tax=Vitrella brassicaformis (strain CCMP3155) TaxID=1169540 RepID=A0A0G4E8K3_VITBC|nr:unnamed protein product [Vitrella brassicaformis CCMP3155]|eukprot:CEL91677.1 unnamed protein product [Vitrella brassicaformis CCMP3155]
MGGKKGGNECQSSLYQKTASWQYQQGINFVKQLALTDADRCLDFGCGTGDITAYMASLAGEVVGLDPDERRLQVARLCHPEVTFVQGRDADVPEGPFSVVFSNYVIQWVTDHDILLVLKRLYQVLKPGGRLALQTTERLPDTIVAATALLPPSDRDAIHADFYWRDADTLRTLGEAVGFETLSLSRKDGMHAYDTLENFFVWWEATTHGVFAVDHIGDEQLQRFAAEWVQADGSVQVVEPNFALVLSKPGGEKGA